MTLYGLSENDFPPSMTEKNYPYYKSVVYVWKIAIALSYVSVGRNGPDREGEETNDEDFH